MRSVLPAATWARLQLLRQRLTLLRYRPRRVQHSYGGFALELELADPLAEGWYDRDWPLPAELALLARGRLRPGARVFDLGAHQGVVALMLSKLVGEEGMVVAVEASAHNAARARRNRALNRAHQLEVVHAAAAATSGTARFNGTLNGHLLRAGGGYEVPAWSVDDLAERYGQPDVLFLDVEGYEERVLQGAARTLSRRPDAFVEVHVGCGLEEAGGDGAAVVARFPADAYELFVAAGEGREFAPYRPGDPLPASRFFLVALAREQGIPRHVRRRAATTVPTRGQEADIVRNLYRHHEGGVRGSFAGKPEVAWDHYGRYARFLLEHDEDRGRWLLDLGCGSGWSTALLRRTRPRVLGADLGARPEVGELDPQAPFITADACRLPLADETCDTVGMHELLEHIVFPEAALEEALRVLRPRGRLVVVGPHLLSVGLSLRAVLSEARGLLRGDRGLRRTPGGPRHPFGNTLPEAIAALAHHARHSVRKLRGEVPARFLERCPDTRPPFHADNDATYWLNPMDLINWARARRDVRVVRWWAPDRAYGRLLWPMGGGTWIVLEKTG